MKIIYSDIEILVDSREHEEKIEYNILKYFTVKKIPYKIQKLEFGDYSFTYQGTSFEEEFAIERKASLEELAGNFGKYRTRFEAEFKRAEEAKIILMIEDDYKCFEKYDFRLELDRILKLHGFANAAKEIIQLLKKRIRFGYKDIIEHNYNTKLNNKAFYGSLLSWRNKYNLDIDFVPAYLSGLHIYYNCYYFLKNKLRE